MTRPHEVELDDLRCLCNPAMFDFDTTAEIEPLAWMASSNTSRGWSRSRPPGGFPSAASGMSE